MTAKKFVSVEGKLGGVLVVETHGPDALAFSLPKHGDVSIVLDAQAACEVLTVLADWLAWKRGEALGGGVA